MKKYKIKFTQNLSSHSPRFPADLRALTCFSYLKNTIVNLT